MEVRWILVVSAVFTCSLGATVGDETPVRVGLERPTDKPIEVSEYDLTQTLGSTFPGAEIVSGNNAVNSEGNAEVQSTTTPAPSVEGPVGNEEVPQDIARDTNDEFPENCECVPYYLCNTNRTIIEDGEGLIDIRIKTGPCDYMDVCCGTGETLQPGQEITPTTPPTPTVPMYDSCGKRNLVGVSSLRIIGDEDNEAQFGEFPWMVAIIRKNVIDGKEMMNVYQCGGSLISTTVVLTAAHCVKGKTDLSVRVGEWDTQRKTEPLPTQTRAVRVAVVHEQFYAGGLVNDIALLFLESPVSLAPNVATICLPEQGTSMNNRECVASGWGKDVFGKEGMYQVILKKVELPVVSKEPCQEALRKTRLGKHFKLHNSFLCAGGVPGKDTCKGDGGSPLVCPRSDNSEVYEQAGIVAWGIGCGTETPGVYVDVAQFRDWIDEKMSIYNIDVRNIPNTPKE